MRVTITDDLDPAGHDLHCVLIGDDEPLPGALADCSGAADVRSERGESTLLRPAAGAGFPERVLVLGAGSRATLADEHLRVAAAQAFRELRRARGSRLSWRLPDELPGAGPAIVEGTVLSSYELNGLKSSGDPDGDAPESLTLLGAADPDSVEMSRVAAAAANRARVLQELPANIADPEYLAERARQIAAAHDGVECELLGPAELEAAGMGGLLSVGAGSAKDPVLIVLRHRGPGRRVALVGKGVTFDTGGISIKPSAGMADMKKDMSGGAAVLEATAAVAELGLEIDLLAIVPAVENMPSGTATRPGDIITQMNGKTVEVNNTDAEGRLILADGLTYAARDGASCLIDIATLTGAVITALGSTHAAVVGTDDQLVAVLERAGREAGELLWRLPLHPEYAALMEGTTADLTNAAPKRKAGTITAAAFLQHFTDDLPWAHLDIAGTAWGVGREYLGEGPSGFGTRLLVRALASLAVQES